MNFKDPDRDSELDRELRSHLQSEEEDLLAQGYTPDVARSASRRVLGNVEKIKEEVRETWKGNLFHNVVRDVRYGARNLLRTPGFTLAAVLC